MRDKRVAIITGASRGIGAAVAERLAGDGFAVVINYSSDPAPGEALARKIERNGGGALTAKADVSSPEAVRGMFDAAESAFGGIDVLVNNAGIMQLSNVADTDNAAFERQVNVNLRGSSTRCERPPPVFATAAASSTSPPAAESSERTLEPPRYAARSNGWKERLRDRQRGCLSRPSGNVPAHRHQGLALAADRGLSGSPFAEAYRFVQMPELTEATLIRHWTTPSTAAEFR